MSDGTASMLAPELTTLALCWRIARRDGVALGFTSHDRALVVGGLRYEAVPGMSPSAVTITDGTAVDTMEVAGALTADAISAADLAAGRFDGAAVALFMTDWTDPAGARLPLARGTLGTVTRELSGAGGKFVATMRGPTAAFDAMAVESCSPACRADLGDRRCRVDLAPLTTVGTVVDAAAQQVVIAGLTDLSRFVEGRLRPLNGPNAGLDVGIAGTDGTALQLVDAFATTITPGTRVRLTQGCDKRFATCTGRFGNAVNFRGEPHVPGGDLLTRFPGV